MEKIQEEEDDCTGNEMKHRKFASEWQDAIESIYNRYEFLHNLFEKVSAYFCLFILVLISISFQWQKSMINGMNSFKTKEGKKDVDPYYNIKLDVNDLTP